MKRLGGACLILTCLTGGVGWIFYEPYEPTRLYEPIPAYASFISVHEEASDRWQDWAQNPLAQSLLASAGLRPQDLEAARQDDRLQFLFSTLAGQRTVLAYLPSMGESGLPGWAFSSWLGGRSGWLRWMLRLYPQESLISVGSSRGVDLWMVDDGGDQAERLYFSISRGMMVGCYAGDPGALRTLLNLMDFGNPHWEELSVKLQPDRVCASGYIPDRGWVDAPNPHWGGGVQFALEEVDADTLKGRVCTDIDLSDLPIVSNEAVRRALDTFALPDAIIWGVTGLGSLQPWLKQRYAVDDAVFGLPSSTPVYVGIQSGDFSGRYIGMKVPSMVVALRVAAEGEAYRMVNRVLDAMNREQQLGLVPRVVVNQGYALTVVDATVRSPYSSLPDQDKVAFLYRDGWLIFGSHNRALTQLAAWMDSGTTGGKGVFDDSAEPAQAHLWTDVDALRTTLPPILQMMKFKLLLDRGPDSKARRQTLSEIESWLVSFSPFEEGRISLYSAPSETIIDIYAGSHN